MKTCILLLIVLVIPKVFFAQEMQQPQLGATLDSIDKITDETDSLIKSTKKEFLVAANTIDNRPVQEKWQYAYRYPKQLAFLQISWHLDSSYYEEDYYIGNKFLLFSEEKHIWYMPHRYGNSETAHWMEECYFIKNKLIHEISHGHGITESDDYNPEKVVLERFNKRINSFQGQKLYW